MTFEPLGLTGAYLVRPEAIRDQRGFLARIYSAEEFRRIGFGERVVHINHTRTTSRGTVRGLHYQLPPASESKVVKCIRGRVFDVIVDLRAGSATLLQWASAELSEENMEMMFVPKGFAHGFQSLTDGCELLYLHSAAYSKEAERGLRADDPQIGIRWPLPIGFRSDRDLAHPLIGQGRFEAVHL
jgi:dTDP-4-dehydrorhamnose 3,5-epimerase